MANSPTIATHWKHWNPSPTRVPAVKDLHEGVVAAERTVLHTQLASANNEVTLLRSILGSGMDLQQQQQQGQELARLKQELQVFLGLSAFLPAHLGRKSMAASATQDFGIRSSVWR
eukprot:1136861-Pelagomonas_calceolata.AAC.3